MKPHPRNAIRSGSSIEGNQPQSYLSEASDSFREPVLDSREVRRHESAQGCHFGIASDLRLELIVIRLRQDTQRVVAVAGGFERRLPRSSVLFGHDVVVELPEDCQHRHLDLTKRWTR